ncbi:MAG: YlxR family protein [Clostridia bacterium]|nr:YlxR family protein [Clostridia bacterium]
MAEKKKHVPQRMCAGCRGMFDKNTLIRVVADGDKVIIDKNQNILSRGAYVCRNSECIGVVQKRRAFNKLICKAVDNGFYEELTDYAK